MTFNKRLSAFFKVDNSRYLFYSVIFLALSLAFLFSSYTYFGRNDIGVYSDNSLSNSEKDTVLEVYFILTDKFSKIKLKNGSSLDNSYISINRLNKKDSKTKKVYTILKKNKIKYIKLFSADQKIFVGKISYNVKENQLGNKKYVKKLNKILENISKKLAAKNNIIKEVYPVYISVVERKPFKFDIEELAPNFDYSKVFLEKSGVSSIVDPNRFGSYVAKSVANGNLYIALSEAPNEADGAIILKYTGKGEPRYVGRLDEQGTSFMLATGNRVLIPGQDPAFGDNWDYGNFYILKNDTITKYREGSGLIGVVHGDSLAIDKNKNIYYMASTEKFNCGDTTCYGKIFKSTDNGHSFKPIKNLHYRRRQIIYYKGYLYYVDTSKGYIGWSIDPKIVSAKIVKMDIDGVTVGEYTLSKEDVQLIGTHDNFIIFKGQLVLVGPGTSISPKKVLVIEDINNVVEKPLPFSVFSNTGEAKFHFVAPGDGYLYTITRKGGSDVEEIVRTKDKNFTKWELLVETDKKFSSIGYWKGGNSLILGVIGVPSKIYKLTLPNKKDYVEPVYLQNTTSTPTPQATTPIPTSTITPTQTPTPTPLPENLSGPVNISDISVTQNLSSDSITINWEHTKTQVSENFEKYNVYRTYLPKDKSLYVYDMKKTKVASLINDKQYIETDKSILFDDSGVLLYQVEVVNTENGKKAKLADAPLIEVYPYLIDTSKQYVSMGISVYSPFSTIKELSNGSIEVATTKFYDSYFIWHPETQSFAIYNDSLNSPEESIEPYKPFLLSTTNYNSLNKDTYYIIAGKSPKDFFPAINLKKGQNLILITARHTTLFNASDLLNSIPNSTKVMDPETYKIYLPNSANAQEDFALLSGKSYFVNVSKDTIWQYSK